MKINNIIKESKSYLYEGLEPADVRSVKLWESAGQRLVEAELTVDQINQIFAAAEQGATAAGSNRTLLGKGKDAASAVNKAWEDLKTKVQNSGPIANVDAAYDNAVAKIEAGLGGPDNAVNQVIQKYRKFAKEHPIAQGLIYSALIAAAGISGAGLGGAAVLGLLKMTDKLLQGEKFSSAAYSGAKTGAMAYGASKVGDAIKGAQQHAAVANEPVMPVQPSPSDLAGAQGTSSVSGTLSGVTSDQIAASPVYQQTLADQVRKFGDSPQAMAAAKDIARAKAKAAILRGMDAATNTASDTASSAVSNAVSSAATDAATNASNAVTSFDMPDVGLDSADTSSLANTAADVATSAPKGANMSADYLKKVINGELPRPMISADDAQKALDWQAQNAGGTAGAATQAASTAAQGAGGYSKEYLQKVINGEVPRPMISVDKAKQLLNQSYVNSKPMVEYIDRETTLRAWVLRESVGKPRGGVALTEAGIDAIFGSIVNEGPGWDAFKAGAKQAGQGLAGMAKGAWTGTKNVAGQAAGAVDSAINKAGGAIGQKLAKVGHNLTTKVTADKLMSAWKKAGSPTDSAAVAKVLADAGVGQDVISSVYQQFKIPMAPTATPAAGAQGGEQPGAGKPAQPAGAAAPGKAAAPAGGTITSPNPKDPKAAAGGTGTGTPAGSTGTPAAGAKADPTAPDADNMANRALAGDPNDPTKISLAGAIKGANQAWKRGLSTPLGQSVVAPTPASKTKTAAPAAQPATPGAAVPAVTPAPAAAEPVAKKHTGGKVAGQLSQTPGAIKKRAARAAASSANQAGAGAFGQMASQLGQAGQAAPAAAPAAAVPAGMPKLGPGVSPQATMAPSKVSYNINLPKAAPAPAKKAVQTAGKINRRPAVTEQIDIAEVLWRKMKSKR